MQGAVHLLAQTQLFYIYNTHTVSLLLRVKAYSTFQYFTRVLSCTHTHQQAFPPFLSSAERIRAAQVWTTLQHERHETEETQQRAGEPGPAEQLDSRSGRRGRASGR